MCVCVCRIEFRVFYGYLQLPTVLTTSLLGVLRHLGVTELKWKTEKSIFSIIVSDKTLPDIAYKKKSPFITTNFYILKSPQTHIKIIATAQVL